MDNFHYYGATAYGWATGNSRDKVVGMLARSAGAAIIKRQKASNGGLAGVVCRVELPEAAHYSINEYMPELIQKEDGVNDTRKGQPVPLTEVEKIRITTVSGKTIPRD